MPSGHTAIVLARMGIQPFHSVRYLLAVLAFHHGSAMNGVVPIHSKATGNVRNGPPTTTSTIYILRNCAPQEQRPSLRNKSPMRRFTHDTDLRYGRSYSLRASRGHVSERGHLDGASSMRIFPQHSAYICDVGMSAAKPIIIIHSCTQLHHAGLNILLPPCTHFALSSTCALLVNVCCQC